MKTLAVATLAALLGSSAQAADVIAGDYINMWFRLNIDQFQAPHAAFSEDA
ncbi:hypothetical protein LEL_07903 [Akanthomyces lecanii RCEF 1005]|uniref:Uncharacterized protein n=1 Tax=Akanthomyces lecanii RCEF 1005 TaxID=1081108 RepID=A0A162JVJ1_CORDF|nr:hypothetical protein LEL_07903 [Akanthomyces lecanii RCEF 1005]